MSATTHQGQRTMPVRQLGTALAAAALALILAVAVALGQLAAAKPQADPAAGAAPGQFDHGWSSDSSNVPLTTGGGSGQFDHGWSSDSSNVPITTGPGGLGRAPIPR